LAFKSRVTKRPLQVLVAVLEAIIAIIIFFYISGSNLQPSNIWLITFVLLGLTLVLLVFHALASKAIPAIGESRFCIFCGSRLVASSKCSKCQRPQPKPPEQHSLMRRSEGPNSDNG